MSASNLTSNVDSTSRENDFKQSGGTIYTANSNEGTYTYYHDTTTSCIWLQWVKSSTEGNGFGTEVMRRMVEWSNEKKCPGELKVDACYSSHLFYLFMGMMPADKPLSYFNRMSLFAQEVIMKHLPSIETEEDITSEDKSVIAKLKETLREEKGWARTREVSNQDLLNNREFLLSLKTKTISYLKDRFIPNLLSLFENHLKKQNQEKYPSTLSWLSIQMVFSPEGKKRWLEAVKDNKPFTPFKKLEHLTPHMSDEQKIRWDAILKKLNDKSAITGSTLFADQKKMASENKAKPPAPK